MLRKLFFFTLVSSSLIMGAIFGMLLMRALAAPYTDVSVAEAKTIIDQRPWLEILDVRNQSEYDSGHIRNAKLIPMWQLASRLNELNKTDEILVYCMKGGYAAVSLILADNGFSHLYNLLGGITAWTSAGYPIYIKYTSIQEAIDNATIGDRINVSSGLYTEHLIIDKPLTLQGENKYTSIIDGTGNGTVIDVSSENVTITDFTIRASGCACTGSAGVYVRPGSKNLNFASNYIVNDSSGIKLLEASNVSMSQNEITDNSVGIEILLSSGNSITENKIASNICGIYLNGSSGNIIIHNNVTDNPIGSGVVLFSSNGNILAENEIETSAYGLTLYSSFNNTFNGNLVAHTLVGIRVINATGNRLCQNNFMKNTQHIYFYGPSLTNTWDGGNATGGNYWDNYTGVDSNHDGIGSTPNILGSGNQDNFPLMGMFSVFTTSADDKVSVTSNSTVEDLRYFSSNNTISMHVTNMTEDQQYGFCRLTIPHNVLPPSYTVTINKDPTNYTIIFENDTMSIIYFSYHHSTIEILVIPEHVSSVFLVILGGAALLSLMVCRRKHTRTYSATLFTQPNQLSDSARMEKIGRVTSGFKDVTEVQMKSNKSSKLPCTEFKIWESSSTGRSSFQQVLKRKSFKMQYLKKSGVNSKTRAGRSIIMEISFEEIARKYRLVKAGKTEIDLLVWNRKLNHT